MTLKSIIESILFTQGEPVALTALSAATGQSEEDILSSLGEIREDYRERGLALLEHDGMWQLGTHPDAAPYLATFLKNEIKEELSRAALETLAIVAYQGPVTRAEIEYVRGVNSSFTLRHLFMRGLLERTGNPDDARAFRYQITLDFLRHLGLSSLQELPHFEEFNKKNIKAPEESVELGETSEI